MYSLSMSHSTSCRSCIYLFLQTLKPAVICASKTIRNGLKNSMHGVYIQEQKHVECRKDVGYREVLCCIRALGAVRDVLGVAEVQRRLVGAVRSVQGARWCRECKQRAHGAQRSAGNVGGA